MMNELTNIGKKKRFVPTCFKKDIANFNKNYQEKLFFSNKYITHFINSNINPKSVYNIIKHLDLTVNQKENDLILTSANKLFQIGQSCDVYSIILNEKLFFNLIKKEKKYKIIRMYNYSNMHKCYFFYFMS